MTEAIFTPEQLAELQAYHRPYYLLAAVGGLVDLAVFAAILRWLVRPMFHLAERAAERLEARLSWLRRAPVARAGVGMLERLWGGPGWGAAILFALVHQLLLAAAYLPFDVYLDFVHEHRFGLSRYSPGAFALDYVKGLALTIGATVALAFGLFGLARRVRRWWLVLGACAGALLLASAALDPYRGRVYFAQEPLPEGPLRERIAALLARAEVDFGEVRVERTSRASARVGAYFAGRGPTRTVVLNDRLLEVMTEDEVLAAVAHEAAHVHEPRWPSFLASVVGLLGFLLLVDRVMRLAAARGWLGVSGLGDIRALPLIALLFYLASGIVRPVTAMLSRERERKADLYALRLTAEPDAFRRMLVKAARVNKMDPAPPGWVVLKGHSHPPIGERIAAVDRGDWKKAGDR